MAGTYTIKVDWDNDGDFEDVGEDVTAYCQEASFERGRDDELGEAVAGIAELRLVNTDNRFSAELTTGPMYGDILPRRRVEIKSTAPEAEDLFTGYISEYDDDPDHRERTIGIYCVDQMDVLARAEIRTPLYTSVLEGYLIAEILSYADWSEGTSWILDTSQLGIDTYLGFSATNIDDGLDTIAYAWWHKVLGRTAIRDIEASCLGFFYVNGSGQACYEDRHHRLKSPHTISQATFNDTMARIKPTYSDKDILNEILATYIPRSIGATGEIWRDREVPWAIQVGQTITVEAEFAEPADNVLAPASTTDYTANSQSGGGGTDMTADISISTTIWAQGARLEITNNGSAVAYMTLLKMRGDAVSDLEEITKVNYDATSQKAYQKRTHNLYGKLISSGNHAQDFCDYILSLKKDPQPTYNIELDGMYSSAVLSAILTLKISDRITVQCARLGLDDDFFINKMQHKITDFGKHHTVQYNIGRASDEDYWIMDTSELGTGTRLAY